MLGYLPTDPALDLLSVRQYLVAMQGKLAWAHLQAQATARAVGALLDEKAEQIDVAAMLALAEAKTTALAPRQTDLRQRRPHWFTETPQA